MPILILCICLCVLVRICMCICMWMSMSVLSKSLARAPPRWTGHEGLFGWPITSHAMLSEVEGQVAPYAVLWRVVVELKAELPHWLDGPFLALDPIDVETRTRDWIAMATE